MRGLWAGAESAKSSSVVVSPPSLSFSSVTTISTVPTTLNGTVGGFVTGETLTFRLDNATSGTVLSTVVTPSTIPANGSASVAVTIPAGTAVGSHTVFAVGSLGTQASAGFVRDTSAPTIAACDDPEERRWHGGVHQAGRRVLRLRERDRQRFAGRRRRDRHRQRHQHHDRHDGCPDVLGVMDGRRDDLRVPERTAHRQRGPDGRERRPTRSRPPTSRATAPHPALSR